MEKPVLDDRQIKDFYRQMVQIRVVEEALLVLFSEGCIRGTVHTSIGQEAIAVGVVNALDRARDVICSNHRGHGHFLAYCNDIKGLIQEIMGLPEGVCGGKGGSQHLQKKNFYSNGILGGMAPVSTGMAKAEKEKQSGAIVTLFIGDGAMAEGAVYEALNMAALWKLPILYVVEMNCYAQSTHWKKEHAGQLENRAASFGIPITPCDGNDVEIVFQETRRIVSEIRFGAGPQVLFCQTYRMGPHSKGDDLRDVSEIEAHREKEPLVRMRRQLDLFWCEEIETKTRTEVSALITEIREGMST